jgi:glycogen debranching enzyme
MRTSDADMNASTHPVQPLLHDELVVLRAPTQVWSAQDGSIGAAPIHGFYYSDLRVVDAHELMVGGTAPDHLATASTSADTATFQSLVRNLDDPTPDPGVRASLTRRATTRGAEESITISSRLGKDIPTTIALRLRADLSELDLIKQGISAVDGTVGAGMTPAGAQWSTDAFTVTISAPGAAVTATGRDIELEWPVVIPAGGAVTVDWSLVATDDLAVVRGDESPVPWSIPTVVGHERLERWIIRALGDLDALRMTTVREPEHGFVAAGSPWFFTLFGRDSLWTARFLLPLGTELAADTLRILAGLQGTNVVAETAEEPGKIMHELRRGVVHLDSGASYLPPLYYGTVDATALWVSVLHDAWVWGLPDAQVEAMLPHLEAALDWIANHADADGDGLLEYVDTSGHGLTNQGWKDSGDSVQWRDGTLAEGPIALCEVQAYAYEAAIGGATLLEHFGRDGAPWREWAAVIKRRFHESFWIEDEHGAYPAIALDAQKRPVDTVTSNIGHLLGTGLLDDAQSSLVAKRLLSPELDSGYGLRTMSTDSDGYWPLSYHGGSVWTHDTAIAISGLAQSGHAAEAATLVEGLLAAASGFDFRMPELHSGDAASDVGTPIPYPAACRPQAWSSAAAVSVLSSILGLEPDAQTGVLSVSPSRAFGALAVSGLRLGDSTVSITVNGEGEVIAASGATIEVR